MSNPFSIPIVLFLFKRADALLQTIDVLRRIKASKIILVGDAGRDETEQQIVQKVRDVVVKAIDWDCVVEKRFAQTNQGVFQQIGLGAKDILEQEGQAIFLEDDNLPEETFFPYCEYLLNKYKQDPRVLWICGTNYLGQYQAPDHSSYLFTRQLLPCGWASWGDKFSKYYDTDLSFLDDKAKRRALRDKYVSGALYRQQLRDAGEERRKMKQGKPPISWDYHMIMSVVRNGLYGIAPCVNQIRNTGMDEMATHGGTNKRNIMAARLCGMPSYPLSFPLIDPAKEEIDLTFEKRISRIRIKPFWQTHWLLLKLWIRRRILHLEDGAPFSTMFKKKRH